MEKLIKIGIGLLILLVVAKLLYNMILPAIIIMILCVCCGFLLKDELIAWKNKLQSFFKK